MLGFLLYFAFLICPDGLQWLQCCTAVCEHGTVLKMNIAAAAITVTVKMCHVIIYCCLKSEKTKSTTWG